MPSGGAWSPKRRSVSMPTKFFINRKAKHEYHILERREAGIALKGSEVKSVREGKVSFTDSFVQIRDREAYLVNLHIAPYWATGHYAEDPKRDRRLLLHKKEIRSLASAAREKGLTLVPLRIYFKNGLVKVEVGLARGRRLYDKREKLKEKDLKRQMERTLKGRSVAKPR